MTQPEKTQAQEHLTRTVARGARHASRANTTYKRFVKDVAARGGFSLEDAEDFSISVVATLEERLTLPEVLDLEAQLPTLLKELLDDEPILDIPRMHKAEFCARVASRLELLPDQVEPIVRVVFDVLRARISEGEAHHVEAQLPSDLKKLWRGGKGA
jgi:uncharacterized protein (DUF2267 family)